MNEWYKDFIGVYENAYSQEWCNDIINLVDKSSLHPRASFEGGDLKKKDLHYKLDLNDSYSQKFISDFFQKYWSSYVSHNPILNEYARHTIFHIKAQKTHPTEGYHTWHCEEGVLEVSRRIAAYTLYLNTVEKGGETEFLYQSLRIPPKQGSLCIFPSGYTHIHRGNPPLTNTKYILTGWVEIFPSKK